MLTDVTIYIPKEHSGNSEYLDIINAGVSRALGTADLPTSQSRNNSRLLLTRLPYVPWGLDNLQPDAYISHLESNVMYYRAMSVISSMIAGSEIICTGKDSNKAETWLRNVGALEPDFISACAWDLAVLNAISFQLLRAPRKKGGGILKVGHLRAANIRSGKRDRFGRIKEMYYAEDWAEIDWNGKLSYNINLSGEPRDIYEIEKFPIYNSERSATHEIYWAYNYSPARTFYPLPAAHAALRALDLQVQILDFHISNIKKGAASSMVLYAPAPKGSTEKQQREDLDRIATQVSQWLSGVDNAGRIAVIPFDPTNPDFKPSLQSFPQNNNDEKFTTLIQLSETTVLTALGIPSGELVGIAKPTGFSAKADEIITALEIMRANTTNPLQNILISALNRLLSDSGYNATVSILSSNPVSTVMSVDEFMAGVVTKNEYRENKHGLKPINEVVQDELL